MSGVDVDGAGGLPAFDASKPMIICVFGKKGSGKSVFNRRVYQSWPFDKIAIDVNGNAEPGDDAEKLTLPLPKQWPAGAVKIGERPRPRNLHFVADPGSPTYRDDLDRAVGVALLPQARRTLVWAGEVGELMPNGRPGPYMNRLLMQNRHYNCSALFDGPRPVYVSPMVLLQANYVVVYDLPNPSDRKRLAETIGWKPAAFDRECEETFGRGEFWFLMYDAQAKRLYRCPPLPLEETAAA